MISTSVLFGLLASVSWSFYAIMFKMGQKRLEDERLPDILSLAYFLLGLCAITLVEAGIIVEDRSQEFPFKRVFALTVRGKNIVGLIAFIKEFLES